MHGARAEGLVSEIGGPRASVESIVIRRFVF
jgi:hypothetical protein